MNLSRGLIDYLASLQITQGRFAGEPFNVLPWQRRFIRGAFKSGAVDSALSVARGNGKTALVAGIGCAAVDGPLMTPRAETIIVASSFEQAKIAFNHILAFLREKHDLGDRRYWRVEDSANRASIENRTTGAKVRVIGSDPRRAHGLAPVLVLMDEPAQWEPASSDRMLAALRTASGKIPEARMIALGTRSSDPEHWFSKMLSGGADYAQTHAAKSGDAPFLKRTWTKANPSMKYMRDLETAIRRESVNAKRDPAELASFEALRLNKGVSDVTRAMLLDASVWAEIEGHADVGGDCIWGVDLGTSAAQSAIAAYWPSTGRLEAFAAFPREPSLAERGLRDGSGRLYIECARRGELITTGGMAVDVQELISEAYLRFGKPSAIGCDRWREAELRDALKAAAIPLTALELRGQGFKDGAEDVRSFTRACLEGKVTPLPSLLLTAAMSEARVLIDPAGNRKLAKGTEGGRRLRARDDAAAATILAIAIGARRPAERKRRLSHGLAG